MLGRSMLYAACLSSMGTLPSGCSLLFGEAEAPSPEGTQQEAEAKADECESPCQLVIEVTTTEETNGGGAVHVLVRETTAVDFPRESYQALVASLSLQSDPQTLIWDAVAPGGSTRYLVDYPEDGELAVYFLFSGPGERWRYLVSGRQTRRLEVRLGLDSIEAIRATKERGP